MAAADACLQATEIVTTLRSGAKPGTRDKPDAADPFAMQRRPKSRVQGKRRKQWYQAPSAKHPCTACSTQFYFSGLQAWTQVPVYTDRLTQTEAGACLVCCIAKYRHNYSLGAQETVVHRLHVIEQQKSSCSHLTCAYRSED